MMDHNLNLELGSTTLCLCDLPSLPFQHTIQATQKSWPRSYKGRFNQASAEWSKMTDPVLSSLELAGHIVQQARIRTSSPVRHVFMLDFLQEHKLFNRSMCCYLQITISEGNKISSPSPFHFLYFQSRVLILNSKHLFPAIFQKLCITSLVGLKILRRKGWIDQSC